MDFVNSHLLLEPADLAARLDDADLLVIAVCSSAVYRQQHVPGAVLIEPAELVSGQKPATGKLPDQQRLESLFSRTGLSPDTFVVAYDDEGGGWAGRLLWTLDVLGHRHYGYLNGGLQAWMAAGYETSSEPVQPRARHYKVQLNSAYIADQSEVLAAVEAGDTLIWDARSAEEYQGIRPGAARNGHIPGAVNLDWLELINRQDNLRLYPADILSKKLNAAGIQGDKPIITHCQTHHRSGLTYLVGKLLGYDIKAYDGSWAEWGNDPDTPIESGP